MRIIGLMPARNEAWCLAHSARVALSWCDELILLNHASSDFTFQVMIDLHKEFDGRVTVIQEWREEWREAEYRQRLLDRARMHKATHVALIDADEALTPNLTGDIRRIASDLQPGQCVRLPWVHCWRGVDQYRVDGPFGDHATTSVLFADAPHLSFQPVGADAYQVHTRHPIGATFVYPLRQQDGGVLHFQHSSWRRLLAKQALYKLTDIIRWKKPIDFTNRLYAQTVSEAGLCLRELPVEWRRDTSDLDVDAEPWQEAEARRLYREHGPAAFAGLDLFGVCP